MKQFNTQRQQQGSIRLSIFLFMITLGAFWYGGQGVYTALKNRKPVTLNYNDLAKGKPSAHWLTINNCEFDLSEAAFEVTKSKYASSSAGIVTEAYLPLHSASGPSAVGPCYVVLATRDPGIIAVVNELRGARNEAEFAVVAAKHQSAMRQKRDVSGLARFGIEDSVSGRLSLLKRDLAPGCIILAEGQQPKLGQSASILFVGFLLAGGMVLAWRSNRETSTDEI